MEITTTPPARGQAQYVDPRLSEIRKLHSEIIASARRSLDQAIRVGELLAKIKAGIKHGLWLGWVKVNLPFSEGTAERYMRLFDRRDELKSVSVTDLTEAYALLTVPKIPASFSWDEPLTEAQFLSVVPDPPPPDRPLDDFDWIFAIVLGRWWDNGRTITFRQINEWYQQCDTRRKEDAMRKGLAA